MIDPRALQQHFRNVNQREHPIEKNVPRVPNIRPLTGIEPIPVIDTLKEQEEIIEITKIESLPISTQQLDPNLNIKQPEITEEEDYNPYGYYSGPRF